MAFFKSVFESGFQFAGFQVLVFCSTGFLFISKVSGKFGWAAKTGFKVFSLCFGQRWFWLAMFRGFGFIPGRLCRFSKLACLFVTKVLVSWVCKTVLASLALWFYGKVRFFQNLRSGRLWFWLAKSIFAASVLVGCRFWLFGVLASSVFLPLLKNKLCVKVGRVGNGSGFQLASLAQSQPTKRAPDVWESARFTSIFLASGFSYISNIVHARPSAGNANRWAVPLQKINNGWIETVFYRPHS